ncbi:MAG: hypothetical protein B9J98_05780 [Candidatus Terraquivivens tikiterensis]|uniref:DUF4870 domain-containing protein n=1 Tax=Candidatus Terraquivivens tikiterensis TaxID=1980982 RepID=A0A2R7Y204_9ARCH|nr:MAG: hypothetical protein B9J98_05780 [Candidatus Terraquivivens tikiterensis]
MSGDEEKTWGFIAWLIPLIGGILVLLFKPSYRYARHWAYLSISFFVVAVVASAVATIISIVPFLAPLGWAISAVLGALFLVAWVLGILKSLNNSYWNPPIIYDLARRLGL